jgi:uncharacterized protein (DUF342 family)
MSNEQSQNVRSENAQAKIVLSDDKSKAYVVLTEHKGNGEPVTMDLINNALKSAGVTRGIDEYEIEEIVKKPQYGTQEPVAYAVPPKRRSKKAAVFFLRFVSIWLDLCKALGI